MTSIIPISAGYLLVCGGKNALPPLYRDCDVIDPTCEPPDRPVMYSAGLLLIWPEGAVATALGHALPLVGSDDVGTTIPGWTVAYSTTTGDEPENTPPDLVGVYSMLGAFLSGSLQLDGLPVEGKNAVCVVTDWDDEEGSSRLDIMSNILPHGEFEVSFDDGSTELISFVLGDTMARATLNGPQYELKKAVSVDLSGTACANWPQFVFGVTEPED